MRGRLTYYSAVWWCTAVWQSLNREILQEKRAVPPDVRPSQATINHQQNHRSLPHIHPPVRYTNKPTRRGAVFHRTTAVCRTTRTAEQSKHQPEQSAKQPLEHRTIRFAEQPPRTTSLPNNHHSPMQSSK
jgi:hypothetical protein